MADDENEPHSDNNESNEEELNDINMHDYKGYFVEKEEKEDEGDKEDEEPIYYEHGAHFPYQFLFQQLEIIAKRQEREESTANRHNRTTSNENQAEGNYSRNTNDNNHNIFGFMNNNERSRNRNANQIVFTNLNENDKENEKEKGKSHNPIQVKPNINNHIETKPEENAAVYLKTKTEPKAILYSAFGSKLKINKRFNFSKKKIINEAKPVILKTVLQFTSTNNNVKSKSKTLVNSNYQDGRGKRKELSVSSNTNNHNSSITKQKKVSYNANINTGISNNSIPKALNNMLNSNKNKQKAYFSPGTMPLGTKVAKQPQMKRTLTAQSQAKNKKALETTCQNKKQLTISLEKTNKQRKKIDSPTNGSNQKEEKCNTHSTSKPTSAITYHPKAINPLPNRIKDIVFSISSATNNISRNVNGKSDTIVKSKTNQNDNTNYREDSLTQANVNGSPTHNMTSQIKTMNIDIAKQIPHAHLQTVKHCNNNPSNSKSKVVAPLNKMKTYFEIKSGLNPNCKSNLINEIQKSMGISTLFAKTKKSNAGEDNAQANNVKPQTRLNIATKSKVPNDKTASTLSKGRNANPQFTSSVITQKTVSQPNKNQRNANSKSHLASNEIGPSKGGVKHFNQLLNSNQAQVSSNIKSKK